MSPSVLQEGTMRRRARREELRRRRRRRRLVLVALMALLAAGAGLAATYGGGSTAPRLAGVGGAGGGGRGGGRARHARSGDRGRSAAPAAGSASGSTYATLPAPVTVRVKLHLGLRSGLLFDVRTGRVLWQRAPERILPIASLTKMMTALVVVAHASPRERVFITRDALNYSGSGVGLLPLHHHVELRTLLYGLLLPSGNDAAIALADHVAGSQSRFVALMNRQAARMHLSCTHFTSVSGIVDRGNHSCAVDLAAMAHAVLTNRLLGHIVASEYATLPFPIRGGRLYLYNNNPLLLDRYPGADGVKTGYTAAAGRCLVAAARRGRAWFAVVLLNSGDTTTQAETLLNAAFATLAPRPAPGPAAERRAGGGRGSQPATLAK